MIRKLLAKLFGPRVVYIDNYTGKPAHPAFARMFPDQVTKQ